MGADGWELPCSLLSLFDMTEYEHILDNRQRCVVDHLRQHLSAAEVFCLVSAYFTIYGYEALQSELRGVGDVRFLFGDPASVSELDPGEKVQAWAAGRVPTLKST